MQRAHASVANLGDEDGLLIKSSEFPPETNRTRNKNRKNNAAAQHGMQLLFFATSTIFYLAHRHQERLENRAARKKMTGICHITINTSSERERV